MKKNALYILITLFICSCSSTKYVPDNEELLTKNSIFIDSIKSKNGELDQFIIQRPNAKTLGLPVALYFYNLGNPNGSKDVNEWKKKHPKTYNFTKKVFSEKQSIVLGNTFVKFNQWFLKNGQKPIVINKNKTNKTVKNLKEFYKNKGYFKSKVNYNKINSGSKKAFIEYHITKGKPLKIENLSSAIDAKVLDSIYNLNNHKSFLKTNTQYNNQNFVEEAERLTKLFRNNGIYNFNTNSIRFIVDTLKGDYKANVVTKIKNIDAKKHSVFNIKNIDVVTNYSFNTSVQKKYIQNFRGINFISSKKNRYNPKYLYESIFIRPNQIYSDSLRNLTKTHLRQLKNFKLTSIKYKQLNDKELDAKIFLTPIEKYTLGFETELSRSNIRNYDIAIKFSLTNRNIFRGAEIFKISGQGSYFNSKNGLGWNFGSEASIEVPRFMAPFGLNRVVSKKMFPKTRFSVGASIQKNIGLDKQIFNLGIDYKWRSNNKKYQLEILNTQYIRNFNVDNYFDIYSSELQKLKSFAPKYTGITNALNNYAEIVKFMTEVAEYNLPDSSYIKSYLQNLNIYNRHNIITSDFLIPVIAFNFTYTTKDNIDDKNFFYLRTRIANSGNIIGYLNNPSENSQNDALEKPSEKTTLFKIPVAQYFKTDIELKKFWNLSRTSTLGSRLFLGAIFTYNNSNIPFSKSYFAGGSNDIRAWNIYELGPGNRPQLLEFNIGSFKLLGNIEYRFDIVGPVKGALFIDTGNIWDISNPYYNDEQGKLQSFKDLENIAIGTGFGVRYDLKFLVIRLDVGLKVREPYLSEKRWFSNFGFRNANYNIGINYPF